MMSDPKQLLELVNNDGSEVKAPKLVTAIDFGTGERTVIWFQSSPLHSNTWVYDAFVSDLNKQLSPFVVDWPIMARAA
jgi:hypothetical protein